MKQIRIIWLILSFVAVLGFNTSAQNIQNGGFEEERSSQAVGWRALTGEVYPVEQITVQRPQEKLTIKPLKGERMMKLHNTSLVASVESKKVALSYKPASLFVHYIYFPMNPDERAEVEIFLTRWDTNYNQCDTILHHLELLDSGATIFWKRLEINVVESYRNDFRPDSAWVRFTTSHQNARKGSLLLLDEIWFTEWIRTSTSSHVSPIQSVGPNPLYRGRDQSLWVRFAEPLTVDQVVIQDCLGRTKNLRFQGRNQRKREVEITLPSNWTQSFALIHTLEKGWLRYGPIIQVP
jgi:hypothetical protein